MNMETWNKVKLESEGKDLSLDYLSLKNITLQNSINN